MELLVKNPPANVRVVRDAGSSPGSGRSPGGGDGNLLQYFLPEQSRGEKSLVATAHRGHKSRTQLSTQKM